MRTFDSPEFIPWGGATVPNRILDDFHCMDQPSTGFHGLWDAGESGVRLQGPGKHRDVIYGLADDSTYEERARLVSVRIVGSLDACKEVVFESQLTGL